MSIMNFPFSHLLPVGVCDYKTISDRLLDCKNKRFIPENAESVMVYLFPYYLGADAYKSLNISKYAVSRDYHEIVAEYLEKAVEQLRLVYPNGSFKSFCDNSPIPEVLAAYNAGLGCVGKNGLFINETYGTFCFIGEIVTDIHFESTFEGEKKCLLCGKCEKLCPNAAIKDGKVEKNKCLSHISQKKGELSESERELLRTCGCAWGCDICQNVCPMNAKAEKTPIKEFIDSAKTHFSSGDEIASRAFSWRGEKVINRNIEIIGCKTDEK